MNRGEIWWASLPDSEGSESGFRRPVLLIQADEFTYSRIQTVICALLSTDPHLSKAPGNVALSKRTSGLSKPSVVNVSQLFTVDKAHLTERVKMIDKEILQNIENGLRLVLGV